MQYFAPDEFACQCGCGAGFDDMDVDMLGMLDSARSISGVPYQINSAFRCTEHNYRVGGREDSAHTKGYAVDIACESSRFRKAIISGLLDAGFNRLGVYPDFIHADSDPSKTPEVIWYG